MLIFSKSLESCYIFLTRSYRLFVPAIRNLQLQDDFPENIEFPERRKLRQMEKVPQPLLGLKVRKMPKQLSDIRGPEPTVTFLLHKQFGIRALSGGQMKYGHFEMVRVGINKNIDDTRCFAIWRVDPPWKGVTKKGQGHRMGGGKGNIDHYVTPVKAKRIVIELGGKIDYSEAYPLLRRIADKLPFKAEVVNEEILKREKLEEEDPKKQNINPLSFEFAVKNNIFGCKSWLSSYDSIWFGKYK